MSSRGFQVKPGEVVLYHFTNQEHLSDILIDGHLEPNESNLSRAREHAGPDVVWCTSLATVPNRSEEDAASRMNEPGSEFDTTAIRFTIAVSKRAAKRWGPWSITQKMDPEWRRDLVEAGESTDSWWVVTRRVLRDEWLEIRDMRTDQVYFTRENGNVAYSKPIEYDFEPEYSQADIDRVYDEAYRKAMYEMGDSFDIPSNWLDDQK